MKRKRLAIVEAPNRMARYETKMRYNVELDGKVVGELYYNLRGYVGTLPTPSGANLYIGECGISAYRREVANLNREFSEVIA